MFTRCQACHTVHPLNAAMLAQGGGKYRCGKCQKTGNALDALFDDWPDASQKGTRPGVVPELGAALSLKGTQTSEDGDETDEFPFDEHTASGSRRWLLRSLWISGALVLTGVIILNLLGFFQKPLIDPSWMQATLVRFGIKEPPPDGPHRAVDRIELISRELISHPGKPGVLLLNATIVNRDEKNQIYPHIDVILLDEISQRLARQLFRPQDYVSQGSQIRDGMTPQAYLTISLEIPDPGAKAVGFELQFR